MTTKRIERAIEIINYAIKHNISLRKASVKNGYANTYVKNVKRSVFDAYADGVLKDNDYIKFIEAIEEHQQSKSTKINKNAPLQNLPLIESESTSFQEKNGALNLEWKAGKNYSLDHIRTLDQLLAICEIDLEIWATKDYSINKWDVSMGAKASGTGKSETFQNFQVKAKLEKKLDVVDGRSGAEVFKQMIEGYEAPMLDVSLINKGGKPDLENNLLEINIFDLHIGKLAWAGETNENYDVKIASSRFINGITKLLKRANGFEFSRILFPIGNDFFNSDNQNNTTTAGTPQDEDLRWQKTFNMGCKLLVDGINILKQTGVPIDVMVIPGNHDFERSFYIGAYLEAWFKDDEMININNGASPRKYYSFGNVLLGFTHGSEEKETSLPMLMAGEAKKQWSNTVFHEWHLGHFHRKRIISYSVIDKKDRLLNEDLGVTVRYLSSLTGTEEWHHKKGYVGTTKAAEAFIWNDETGLVGQLNINLIDFNNEH